MLPWDRLSAFLKDESGATAINGLIAADIAVAVIAVVNGLGTKKPNTKFMSISTQLN